MCIIALRPQDGPVIPEAHIESMAKRNDDGMGIAFVDDDGSIVVRKSMNDLDLIKESFKEAYDKNSPTLLHFRIKTHGTTDLANCQPFLVDTELVMAHNGILGGLYNKDGETKSDTLLFVERILQKFPQDWYKYDGVWRLLDDFVGGWNKVAFLWRDKQWAILNEKYGHWDDGIWYSNLSYKPFFRTAATDGTKEVQAEVIVCDSVVEAEDCHKKMEESIADNDLVVVNVEKNGSTYKKSISRWALEYADELNEAGVLNEYGCYMHNGDSTSPFCYGCLDVRDDFNVAYPVDDRFFELTDQCALCGEPLTKTNIGAYKNANMIF